MSSSPDRAPLAALVAYQQQVVFSYQVALAKGPLSAHERTTVERFATQAGQAAAALRRSLRALGGTPSPQPDPALAAPPADTSAGGYLRQVVGAEEASVHACFTAFQTLVDARHIAGTAAFMAQAGRRLVVLRQLSGQRLLPRVFENGA